MEEARFWAASVEKINQLVTIATGNLSPEELDLNEWRTGTTQECEVSSFAEFNRALMS